jgi:fumarate reductase subunit C
MNQTSGYTDYHPRWHRRRMSTWWWLESGAYLRFILRELSSAFIAWFIALTLAQLYALSRGPDSYAKFMTRMQSPLFLALNTVTLFFVVYHAATWFQLAPKALVVHWRGRQVSGKWIAAANYGAWFVASLVVIWAVL